LTKIEDSTQGIRFGKRYSDITKLDQPTLPALTGNQAIGMGLIKAGLKAYIAYPMTPSSSLLDFMARSAEDFGLKVIHPRAKLQLCS